MRLNFSQPAYGRPLPTANHLVRPLVCGERDWPCVAGYAAVPFARPFLHLLRARRASLDLTRFHEPRPWRILVARAAFGVDPAVIHPILDDSDLEDVSHSSSLFLVEGRAGQVQPQVGA